MKFILFGALVLFIGCQSSELPPLDNSVPRAPQRIVGYAQVQPIIQSRCVACHSCLESPCQLNMQTWDGLKRGAFHGAVYDGMRTTAVAPTRMFEDAQTTEQWRGKGFVDVLAGGDNSLFISVLRLTNGRKAAPTTPVRESLICPLAQKLLPTKGENASELSMPYGLPALSPNENELLSAWVAVGSPGESSELTTKTMPKATQGQIHDWLLFLNAKDLKSRIVARYLYEHLFLAHLYFKEAPRDFLKIVRSSTPCEIKIQPIASRRPNDDPGVTDWYYCLYRDPAAVVYKNHLPYEIGAAKLKWLKQNFFGDPWKPTAFPSFSHEVSGNPLLAYNEMPITARHRFLNENAEYEVMTFIKGPVCNGSFAVNSIQDQFFVFFTNPAKDVMDHYPKYAQRAAHELILPGSLSENLSLGKVATSYGDILKSRAKARQDLNAQLVEAFPKGMPLDYIWDGDGHNDNAVLTVFRHDDNAKVVKGARGDTPKTIFVLDYSTFERLVYNLAINFDVYDNVSHQLLSRLYMDILRMDAEDNFLQFLPPGERLRIKGEWYKGLGTQLKLDILDEKKFAAIPAAIPFSLVESSKVQLVRRFIFERLNAAVRGPIDTINWRTLDKVEPKDAIEMTLRRVASTRAAKQGPAYPNFFPELSLLVIERNGIPFKTFSLIHNREHENLSWIFNEESRLSPKEDTLTILPGILGAYPNQFFVVEEAELAAMIATWQGLKTKKKYQEFLRQFGVDRMNPAIWPLYDAMNAELEKLEPIEAGILDLSRYTIGR